MNRAQMSQRQLDSARETARRLLETMTSPRELADMFAELCYEIGEDLQASGAATSGMCADEWMRRGDDWHDAVIPV